MVSLLSDDDVATVLDLEGLLPELAEAFAAQARGAVERPERPHYPMGTGLDPDRPEQPLGTGLCMPAYVHGAAHAVTKLATVHEGNADRGLSTVNAHLSVVDARTGEPTAILAGNRITNARTGAIAGLAARELALPGPVDLGVIGAGRLARWGTRAIATATDLETVRVYSPSDSRIACAEELATELGVDARPVERPREAVTDATVVLTATTSTEPVFPGEALSPGALVVALGAYTPETRELDDVTVERATRVFADVPEEARETGDLRGHPELAVSPFGELFAGDTGRIDDGEILVVASVGTATLDAATAAYVVERAREAGVGEEFPL